jgi:hypothetical protein
MPASSWPTRGPSQRKVMAPEFSRWQMLSPDRPRRNRRRSDELRSEPC